MKCCAFLLKWKLWSQFFSFNSYRRDRRELPQGSLRKQIEQGASFLSVLCGSSQRTLRSKAFSRQSQENPVVR